MLVSVAILLILGVIIIGFLRGALDISRSGASRGEAYAAAQTVMRGVAYDLSQVLAEPAHADGSIDDAAFVVMQDPFGRQMLAFTRAWGEEQRSDAGYDSGRASAQQGYSRDFTGRNVGAAMRPSHGNLEVVYLLEPTPTGTRLYRAERSPPDPAGGLITHMTDWCRQYRSNEIAAQQALEETRIGGESLWGQFQLVAENVVALAVECWDDYTTASWHAGQGGPVHEWFFSARVAQGRYPLPKALRITLIVAGNDPVRAETVLSAALAQGDNSLFVEDTDNFNDPSSGAGFVRVNGELIAYASMSGRTFGSCVRGALGTAPAQHAAGSPVLGGEVFRRVIQLPVAR
jgi:hypothetical protein